MRQWSRVRSLISTFVALLSIAALAGPLAPAALSAPSDIIVVTTCAEAPLRSAIAQAVPGITLTVQYRETDCLIALTSPLVIPPSLNITINGDGLILDGRQSPSGVFDVQNVQGATSLVLNNVEITDGTVGVSLLLTAAGAGATGEAESSCWMRVAQLGTDGAQLAGCQATSDPESTGLSLTCRKQSISDSSKKWVCFGAGQTSGGGQALYAATSLLGPNGGHVTLSTHFRYATYSWQRATARCGIILRRGVTPSLSVTCQASQAMQG